MLKDDDLPNWIAALLASPVFGCIMLVLAIGLAWFAWQLRAGPRANTRIVTGTLAVFAFACAFNTVEIRSMLQPDPESQNFIQNQTVRHVALQAPQRIAGLVLPAASVVTWKSDDHKSAEVQLPGPQQVNGIPLGPNLTLDQFFWVATLTEDHTLDAWPCAAGEIYLGIDGGLQHCSLKSARTLPGFTIPAGSYVELDTDNEFEPPIPVIKVTLKADTIDAPTGASLPNGTFLTLFRNGSIEHAEPSPAGLRVRGIQLSSYVYWRYGLRPGIAPPDGAVVQYVEGRMAGDLACPDRTIPDGTWVGVPPRGSALLVGGKEDAYAFSPVEGCLLGH
jgi:hypothetical protein